MSPRRFWRLLAAIVLVAAAARVGHVVALQGTALWHFCESWVTSDMYQNLHWADRLAAGDWLDREGFRPRFPWQDRVAPPEVWNRWLEPGTYYQPPLYNYLLALVIRATGSPDLFRVLQALLGAVNVGLVGLLGWRVASGRAGLLAAAMAAIYAPWILYDAELLRGTLALTFGLLALLALTEARRMEDRESDGDAGWRARRGWILAGAILGLGYAADSSIVTFLPFAALWVLLGAGEAGGGAPWSRPRMGTALPRLALLAAGLAAALLPLAARNLAVGVGPLAVTTRAPLAFVMGNAPDAMPVGAYIPPSTSAILNASEYRTLPTIAETLKAWRGDAGGMLHLMWRKLSGVFNSFEVPDNPSFDYAALASPVLRYGLRFSCVVGLGLAGMLLAARRPARFGLIYLHAASVLSLFLVASVVSRYRQPLLISLFLFAGYALSESFRAMGRRRPLRALAVLAGAAGISFAMPAHPPPGYRVHRPAEFMAAAAWHEAQGRPKAAGRQLERAIEFSWEEAGPSGERVMLGMEMAALYLRHGMHPQALSALADVLEEDPDHPAALATIGAIHHDINQPWQALQALTRAKQVDPRNAEVWARLGHLYWFVYESPANALAHLQRALELAPDSPAAPRIRALIQEIEARAAVPPPDQGS